MNLSPIAHLSAGADRSTYNLIALYHGSSCQSRSRRQGPVLESHEVAPGIPEAAPSEGQELTLLQQVLRRHVTVSRPEEARVQPESQRHQFSEIENRDLFEVRVALFDFFLPAVQVMGAQGA